MSCILVITAVLQFSMGDWLKIVPRWHRQYQQGCKTRLLSKWLKYLSKYWSCHNDSVMRSRRRSCYASNATHDARHKQRNTHPEYHHVQMIKNGKTCWFLLSHWASVTLLKVLTYHILHHGLVASEHHLHMCQGWELAPSIYFLVCHTPCIPNGSRSFEIRTNNMCCIWMKVLAR